MDRLAITTSVSTYVPPDMWALMDNALVLGTSVALAATTFAAGGGAHSPATDDFVFGLRF